MYALKKYHYCFIKFCISHRPSWMRRESVWEDATSRIMTFVGREQYTYTQKREREMVREIQTQAAWKARENKCKV